MSDKIDNEMVKNIQANKDKIKQNILKTLHETCKIAETTSIALAEQTEIINGIDSSIDKIDDKLVVSENILKRMTSFFPSLIPTKTKKIKSQQCCTEQSSKSNDTFKPADDFYYQLSKEIEELKLHSLYQGDVLDLHNKKLDKINKHVDKADSKMNNLTEKMKQI